ncbi:MAG: carbohydrate kinase, partial [Treponema sp.]|nr:carbohydrate kinase [Treponema sp.]
QAGGFISYDPNYRERLWGGRKDALEKMKSMLSFSDMVKISDEELALFFGEDISYAEGADLIHECGVRLVLVTLGSRGVYYSAKGTDEVFSGTIAVPSVNVVDTTGAGDSFTGGLLYALTRRENPFDFSREELEMDVSFANCVASLCVTKRGAIPALPSLDDVLNFSKEFNIILPLWI